MVQSEQNVLFLMHYVLGESEKNLAEKFPYYMEISNNLEKIHKIEVLKMLRDYTIARNIVVWKYEELKTSDDCFDLMDKFVKEYELDTYCVKRPTILKDLQEQFGEVRVTLVTLFNYIMIELDNMYKEALKLFCTNDDLLADSILSLFYTRKLREKELVNFVETVKKSQREETLILEGNKKYSITTCQNDQDLLTMINAYNKTQFSEFDVEFKWGEHEITNTLVFEHKENSIYYVDCDNIAFKHFLQLLADLKGKTGIRIKLFLDVVSKRVWKTIKAGIYDGIVIEVYEVQRLLDKKSVVDQVLIGHAVKDTIGNKVIVSSDSDYFSLHLVGVDYSVMVEKSFTSQMYLNFLDENDINYKDLEKIGTPILFKPLIEDICKRTTLQHLSTTVLPQWTEGVLLCYLTILINDELEWGITLDDDYAKEIAVYILDNVVIKRENGNTIVAIDDLTHTISQLREIV